MKKIVTLLVAMIFSIGFSQETEKEKPTYSVGLQLTASPLSSFGVFFEDYKKDKNGYYSSRSLELNSVATTLEGGDLEFTGSGFEFAFGNKAYFDKEVKNGFFGKSSLVYGNIKFDELDGLYTYKGTYSYFSLFAPEVGYDFMIAKTIRTSISAGTQWQIEVKGKDDVDNRSFDNWVFNFGVRLSYDI